MGFSRVLYNYNKLEEPRVHTNASLKLVFHNFQLAVYHICTKQKSKHTIFLLLWFKNSCTSIWIYLTLKDAINSILFPCNNRFDFTLVLVEKETLLVVH